MFSCPGSRAMRTGKRCATRTQLSDFWTYGRLRGKLTISGDTIPQPIFSTRPLITVSGLPSTYTEAQAPSSIFASWVSRKKAVACQLRSEEHTSELQSRENLVCRLLLEKKKTNNTNI